MVVLIWNENHRDRSIESLKANVEGTSTGDDHDGDKGEPEKKKSQLQGLKLSHSFWWVALDSLGEALNNNNFVYDSKTNLWFLAKQILGDL